MCLKVPPFYIAIKRGRPSPGGREGGDWLHQKDRDGGKDGTGTSGIHPDVG